MKFIIDEIISKWKYEGTPGKALVLIMAATFALVVMLPVAMYYEHKEWQAFKVEHHCKIVAKTRGDTHVGVGYGMTANGSMGAVTTVSSTSPKTGWLCDDGITYWR